LKRQLSEEEQKDGTKRSRSTESAEMNNSLGTDQSNHHGKAPSSGGFRGLFGKFRKQSDHHSTTSQVQIGSRVYDQNELQKLIPQLEEAVDKKERLLRQAQTQIEAQQGRIIQLESEVKNLQAQCDKLRSVLSQKTESNVATPPASKTSQADELGTDLQTLQKAVLPTPDTHERMTKKMAVSAEPAKLDHHKTTLQHHAKSAGSKQLIRDAVMRNDFLKQLAKEQIIEL